LKDAIVNCETTKSLSMALFPDPRDQKLLEDSLSEMLAEMHVQMRSGSVAPDFDARKFSEELSDFDFTTPVPLEKLLPWVIARMRNGNVQITHPRYFGLFNPAPAAPSLLAERIVASFNPQLASASMSPGAIALEAHVIVQIARRVGLPMDSAGHFTNGGSEANFTALICALTELNPAFSQNGARAFRVPPAIYISRDAHPSWLKIAHQAGIGRLAVRIVETDGHGRMSSDALRSTVAGDIDNGVMPVMVVGTAGTTVAGMVDPLADCANIANEAGAWFHVDAAWGGGAIASSHTRVQLAGIELADSVTIDAHKWFSATMPCGMFISRRSGVLNRVFGTSVPSMPAGGSPQDPSANSVLWSRRFSGLRLFMNLSVAGWQGYAQHVEHTLTLINLLRTSLEATQWKTANPDALGVLCVTPPDGFKPVQKIVEDIVASGQVWISAATFEGAEVVRICVPNGRTEAQDIDTLVEILNFYGQASDGQRVITN
jgi:glutamate/tyrosine decarboxylase-like PLP-dependent enzyme